MHDDNLQQTMVRHSNLGKKIYYKFVCNKVFLVHIVHHQLLFYDHQHILFDNKQHDIANHYHYMYVNILPNHQKTIYNQMMNNVAKKLGEEG